MTSLTAWPDTRTAKAPGDHLYRSATWLLAATPASPNSRPGFTASSRSRTANWPSIWITLPTFCRP
jgi:hypothetical protein